MFYYKLLSVFITILLQTTNKHLLFALTETYDPDNYNYVIRCKRIKINKFQKLPFYS